MPLGRDKEGYSLFNASPAPANSSYMAAIHACPVIHIGLFHHGANQLKHVMGFSCSEARRRHLRGGYSSARMDDKIVADSGTTLHRGKDTFSIDTTRRTVSNRVEEKLILLMYSRLQNRLHPRAQAQNFGPP
jgi:hypothetical protein